MDDLPFLPGYRFSDLTSTNFLVPRTLSFKNGHRIIRLPRLGIGQTRLNELQLTSDERYLLDNFQPELIYGKVRPETSKPFVPARVFYDKKVLRFYGYFQQTVHDSPVECYRVRRVSIYYYLEDDTMAIYEIPYENSALVQGLRVRRHRIAKNDLNEFYNWRDLNLGQNLAIYGTVYRISDCDRFTRDWLESEGIEIGCCEPIPSDPYAQRLSIKSNQEKQRTGPSDLKEILPDRFGNVINIGNKRFYQWDGQVLRFYAILDDDECRQFIIHFYLVDQTIEIREVHQVNDGYDRTGTYLHRQKIPKDSNYNISSFVHLFISKAEQEKIDYINVEDFRLGCPINIFNQRFLLYDCDLCTKDFLRQNFGQIHFPSIDIEKRKRQRQIPVHLPPVPPHLLFGKPEDTIQNVKYLVPRPLKKDLVKLMENQHRVLRYEAKMDSAREIDHQRRFLIIYRLADDLISIYEKPTNGFECVMSKFLERTRIPKPDSHPDTPCYYGPNDFYIGARVEFFKHRFIIIDADRYVLKFLEENSDQFSPDVLNSFREKFQC